ncbi:phytanoyl-CoA dioxygenase family protein [Mangrovihabitans endophyticus]|uniref:L-proline 4-hydroxylase n=1 Tax=Mangrovihabitans endophyticus TaxID=1751298 RepID=A0A8J3FMF7_9ACTN|nr:phytanoyl-CoA dioxygenase family protein [Mangrovihabitans endophyticus]GGK72897.1 L-proline 4-hydroxylase [Mangrovihabitans endophyticus]
MSSAPGTALSELASAYERDGWCPLPYRLSTSAVALLRDRVGAICRQARPEVIWEKGGKAVRAIHGCHRFDEVCAALTRHPRLVALAESFLGGPVYVYQFKVNLKQAREGAAWPWHQDFAFWKREDGMPQPDAVNIAFSLDTVHEGNGPLTVIPGSHHLGLQDMYADGDAAQRSDWQRHVSADLAYTVAAERAGKLADELGTQLITGPAGSIHAFHPNIVHSSTNNESADRRALLLITYNAVRNSPPAPTRPDFLVDRNTAPIVAHEDHRLELCPS